jgi:hypothetical protein
LQVHSLAACSAQLAYKHKQNSVFYRFRLVHYGCCGAGLFTASNCHVFISPPSPSIARATA